MPSDLMTSTMKSEPGRPMIFSPLDAFSFFSESFFSAAGCWAATVLAAIVVPSAAAPFRKSRRSSPSSFILSSSSIENLVQALVVKGAGHRAELVAELALRRRRGVRVEGLARAPDLEHGEMVRAVGLLHDLVAQVARG